MKDYEFKRALGIKKRIETLENQKALMESMLEIAQGAPFPGDNIRVSVSNLRCGGDSAYIDQARLVKFFETEVVVCDEIIEGLEKQFAEI